MPVVYHGDLTIPPQTPPTDPARKELRLEPGRVSRISVFFPWGHGGLTGFRLTRGGEQLFPFPPGTWLIGNDQVYDFPLAVVLTDEPVSVWLEGYNQDEYYEHTVYVQLILEPEQAVARLIDFFRIFIGGR